MEDFTLLLDLDDDGSVRLSSITLAGARVGLRRAGQPERVIQVRTVDESEAASYSLGFRDCNVAGAWHGLDDAGSVTGEALERAGMACATLAAYFQEYGRPAQPARDLESLLTDVIRTHNERVTARQLLCSALEALDRFERGLSSGSGGT